MPSSHIAASWPPTTATCAATWRLPVSLEAKPRGDGRAERHLQRLRTHLRDLVSDAGLSLAEIDRRLGRREGHLSQVLRGEIDLRYAHLLRVLDALPYDPATFFAGVFPRHRPRSSRSQAAPPRQSREVVAVYGLGLEELRRLHRRLERCEAVLERWAVRAPRRDQSRH